MGAEATTGTSHSWSWARLLGRVFVLDMATCPFCNQGALRIIAAITQVEVIRRILRHLKRAADRRRLPGSCSPSNVRLGRLSPAIARGFRNGVRAAAGCLTPLRVCNPV